MDFYEIKRVYDICFEADTYYQNELKNLKKEYANKKQRLVRNRWLYLSRSLPPNLIEEHGISPTNPFPVIFDNEGIKKHVPLSKLLDVPDDTDKIDGLFDIDRTDRSSLVRSIKWKNGLNIIFKNGEDFITYEMSSSQAKIHAGASCTPISFVSCYYMDMHDDPNELLESVPWDEVLEHGKRMWTKWKTESKSIATDYTSLEDIMNLSSLKPLFDELNTFETSYGPLYEELTLEYTPQAKKMFRTLLGKLQDIRESQLKEKRHPVIAVITINGYTISMWVNANKFVVVDSHGVGSLNENATIDIITSPEDTYKRCLYLTRSKEKLTNVVDPSISKTQYTMYHTTCTLGTEKVKEEKEKEEEEEEHK